MINHIKRDFLIDNLTDTHNPLEEFTSEFCSDMKFICTDIYYDNNYDEYLYYKVINGYKQWIFHYKENRELNINTTHYYDVFVAKFNLDHNDISELTKHIFKVKFNKEVSVSYISVADTLYRLNLVLDRIK